MKQHLGVETPYTAVYLVFQTADKIAFVLRSNTGWMDGNYGLPSGRVDKGESFLQAAVREGLEETGAIINQADLRPACVIHRNEPDSVWIDMVFQVMKWEGEIYNAEPEKHGDLTWFDSHHLPGNIVPCVEYYVEQFLAGNSYAEYGWGKEN